MEGAPSPWVSSVPGFGWGLEVVGWALVWPVVMEIDCMLFFLLLM